MPLVYRSMKEENGKPKVERSANGLGVRLDTAGVTDIVPDKQGNVLPNTGGMSVAPAMRHLPVHRVYRGLRHLVEGASARDQSLRIWKMGEGDFVVSPVAPGLALRPTSPTHGLVEPAIIMSLLDYESALAQTRDSWVIDASGN